MELDLKKVGTLNLSGPTIEVTDPCYDRSVWCRITEPISPGNYNCYVGIGEDGWGKRVYRSILLLSDIDISKDRVNAKKVGVIGVDAGLAGFFVNKPDYSDSEWGDICSFTSKENFWIVDETSPMKCKGFFSHSGIGDGCYGVYRLTSCRKFVGYKIDF